MKKNMIGKMTVFGVVICCLCVGVLAVLSDNCEAVEYSDYEYYEYENYEYQYEDYEYTDYEYEDYGYYKYSYYSYVYKVLTYLQTLLERFPVYAKLLALLCC